MGEVGLATSFVVEMYEKVQGEVANHNSAHVDNTCGGVDDGRIPLEIGQLCDCNNVLSRNILGLVANIPKLNDAAEHNGREGANVAVGESNRAEIIETIAE